MSDKDMAPSLYVLRVGNLWGLRIMWSWREELNLQPAVYKSVIGGLLKSLKIWATPSSSLTRSEDASCRSLFLLSPFLRGLQLFLTP